MSKQIYSESDLIQKYQNREITLVEYITLHPDGMEDDYLDFCEREGMDINELSAGAFLDWKEELFEEALKLGNA